MNKLKSKGKDSEQPPNLETGRKVGYYIKIWRCSSSSNNEAEQAIELHVNKETFKPDC